MTTDVQTRPEVEAPAAPPTLRVADRCDCRCGAQAFVLVQVVPDAGPLLFCKHHFEKHEAALIVDGAKVLLDARSDLMKRPSNINGV